MKIVDKLVTRTTENVKGNVQETVKEAVANAKTNAVVHVRENPKAYAAGAAITCVLGGFLLGRRVKPVVVTVNVTNVVSCGSKL